MIDNNRDGSDGIIKSFVRSFVRSLICFKFGCKAERITTNRFQQIIIIIQITNWNCTSNAEAKDINIQWTATLPIRLNWINDDELKTIET